MKIVGHLNFRKQNLLPEAIAILFILLLTYAASSKLMNFHTFQSQIAQSPVFSSIAEYIAFGVPFIELVISGFLIFEKYRLQALTAAYSLMIMFTTYIIIILNFSDFIPCSCGGILERLSWNEHLIFNFILIGLALVGIFLSPDVGSTNKKL